MLVIHCFNSSSYIHTIVWVFLFPMMTFVSGFLKCCDHAGSNQKYFHSNSMSEDEVTDRVNATKYYIKNYYDQLYNGIQQREMRRQELEDAISQSQLTEDERDRLLNVYLEKESEYMRLKRKKMTIADFKTLKVIGKGSFGEVRLVKDKETDEVFALKKMSKTAMVEQKQINNIRNERDIMTEFNDNPWVVTLYYSFQDTEFLYFVMAYYPGGDLWNLLQNTGLSEDEIRFYLAEIVLSIDSIHQMEYFHRDLKPENILFDQEGHIKLADFGLCKPIGEQHEPLINSLKDKEAREKVAKAHENTSTKYKIDTWRKQRKELAFSVVGTPGYAAPEVMYETGYGKECDWWSLGVMFFEMLFGYHPFHADSIEELCINVLNWQSTLKFPSDIDVSDEAKDMLSG
eukprot:TRINITY_DN2160_c0_g1_i11.p1 TRINITY_DN2160_c0_g1~~TRINITY_DN2160_c0_g1_i11.p1  ORF type:complete len:401 (+),score=124.17 TRINITY_DN2160_c0_g1_i11:68-1270(+)